MSTGATASTATPINSHSSHAEISQFVNSKLSQLSPLSRKTLRDSHARLHLWLPEVCAANCSRIFAQASLRPNQAETSDITAIPLDSNAFALPNGRIAHRQCGLVTLAAISGFDVPPVPTVLDPWKDPSRTETPFVVCDITNPDTGETGILEGRAEIYRPWADEFSYSVMLDHLEDGIPMTLRRWKRIAERLIGDGTHPSLFFQVPLQHELLEQYAHPGSIASIFGLVEDPDVAFSLGWRIQNKKYPDINRKGFSEGNLAWKYDTEKCTQSKQNQLSGLHFFPAFDNENEDTQAGWELVNEPAQGTDISDFGARSIVEEDGPTVGKGLWVNIMGVTVDPTQSHVGDGGPRSRGPGRNMTPEWLLEMHGKEITRGGDHLHNLFHEAHYRELDASRSGGRIRLSYSQILQGGIRDTPTVFATISEHPISEYKPPQVPGENDESEMDLDADLGPQH